MTWGGAQGLKSEDGVNNLDAIERIDKCTVALLASSYVVSPEAMKIRLTNVGITGPY